MTFRPFSTSFSIMALLLLSLAGASQAQERPPLLTSSGTGTVSVPPDKATVSLGVEQTSATAQEAQSRANRAVNRLLKSLESRGVAPDRLRTSGLSLYPIRDQRRPGAQGRETVYRANYTVSIEVLDLDQTGPLIDAALEAGANRLQGVRFGLSEEGSARKSALEKAIQDALGKARLMASAAGIELAGIQEITEVQANLRPVQIQEMMVASEAASTSVLPGMVDVSAEIVVRFKIRE